MPKHGGTAARRNELKRRLREIGRVEILPRLEQARAGVDVLVRARKEAYGAGFHELRDELIQFTESRWQSTSSSA